MVTGVKRDYGNLIYMRIQKHKCPDCGHSVFLKKIKRKIKSSSKNAKDFDFNIGNVELSGTVKFIWYEFKCTYCGNQFTESQMKAFEELEKKEAKALKKQKRKEAKASRKGK